ncbi:MAG: hypothetical protein KKA10_18030 [Euryarchaeota archaeon]|nr:hypothetical protein [Euryarchaeota archaeon]
MHAYGPVPSRRLGRSLGVSPIPLKTCSYNCIYCQLGRTHRHQINRESFYPRKEILNDVQKVIERIKPDKIHISVPTRPPAEPWVSPPAPERIIRAHEIIGTASDLTQYESGEFGVFPDARTSIMDICSRHPLREEQARVIEKKFSEAGCIDEMLLKNILVRVEYRNISYLLPAGFVRGK